MNLSKESNPNPNPTPQTAAAISPENRRRDVRIPHKAVLVMPYGEGVTSGFEEAMLADCSRNGVGLILQRPLRPGIHLFLKLKLTTVALVVYSVKHCRPIDE